MRIFNVTGTGTARTVASSSFAAVTSSRISALPAICPTATFLTGQPKLMSTMAAPRPTAIRAASAIAAGSQPASSCREAGDPSGSPACISAMRRVLRFSRTIAQEAIISETTSPVPRARATRRNGRSVTPDIGARITGVSITTPAPRSIGEQANCTGATGLPVI